jgi:hypothetical protein
MLSQTTLEAGFGEDLAKRLVLDFRLITYTAPKQADTAATQQ